MFPAYLGMSQYSYSNYVPTYLNLRLILLPLKNMSFTYCFRKIFIAPTQFHANCISTHYFERLQILWSNIKVTDLLWDTSTFTSFKSTRHLAHLNQIHLNSSNTWQIVLLSFTPFSTMALQSFGKIQVTPFTCEIQQQIAF